MTTASTHDRTPRTRLRRTLAALMLGTTMLAGPVGIAAVATPHSVAAQSIAPQDTPGSFADLASRVSPAVVNISTTRTAEAERGPAVPPGFPPGTPFEEFFRQFRDQFGQGGPQGGPQGGLQNEPDEDGDQAPHGKVGALGSGFIVDASGYVVTNNHVIDGADEITVTLQDGTELPAKLIGRDQKTDIALLKVKPEKPLPALEWGDSDKARVGDWVLAVGNPFGLGGTVTKGIISARGRDIHSGPYDDFLQLDAAINRGNSGGPTFTMDGRVIGINTAIYSPNGGSVGIGFAIPSNLARNVVAQLRESGQVERGWLGVKIQEVTPDIAESVDLAQAKGALVAEVTAGSPAAKTGLRAGDVIVGYNGHAVEKLRDLTRAVADSKPGDKAELQIARGGKTETLTASIDRLPEEPQQVAAAETGAQAEPAKAVHGLKLAPLDAAARSRLSLGEGVTGVVVTGVTKQAGDSPVRPGDVIVRIGENAVRTPSDVTHRIAEAEKAGRKTVLLLLNRKGSESFVAFKLGQA